MQKFQVLFCNSTAFSCFLSLSLVKLLLKSFEQTRGKWVILRKSLGWTPQKQMGIFVLILGLLWLSLSLIFFNMSAPNINTEIPLLLNSGLVSSTSSDISLVIWLEEGEHAGEIQEKLPQRGWTWKQTTLQSSSGGNVVTLSGSYRVQSRLDELEVYKVYQDLTNYARPIDGMVYLHERIPESIDPAAYLSLVSANPLQWAQSNNTLSIAGYRANMAPDVVAGTDKINVQVLTRQNETSSMTILALPALLEEF